MYSFSVESHAQPFIPENEPLTSPEESNRNPLSTSGDFHGR
jgi:hypothetical protein